MTPTTQETDNLSAKTEARTTAVRQALFCDECEGVSGTSSPEREARGERSRKCTRVLIIEDNVDAAESLRDLFLLGNREVEVAYDGRSGIAKAHRFRPDLVMCDIGLPGMDGYEVVRVLRRHPSLSRSRIVAWTGYSRAEDIRRCAEAGFHATMAKPLTKEQLKQLLAYDVG